MSLLVAEKLEKLPKAIDAGASFIWAHNNDGNLEQTSRLFARMIAKEIGMEEVARKEDLVQHDMARFYAEPDPHEGETVANAPECIILSLGWREKVMGIALQGLSSPVVARFYAEPDPHEGEAVANAPECIILSLGWRDKVMDIALPGLSSPVVSDLVSNRLTVWTRALCPCWRRLKSATSRSGRERNPDAEKHIVSLFVSAERRVPSELHSNASMEY
ncbi:hypothetical protein J3Q64DRAFT_1693091 [Phycomyces blakesleeanus]|uniref:Uncharacterized protein n=1 Tax=Phycomyces blakesleeanus TaxID=4837 RepID=A0ABR3BD55_PHYBL